MFSLNLPQARVVAPEGLGFVSVNIISSGQLQKASPRTGSRWEVGTAHVIDHDTCKFDFTTGESFESTALFFEKSLLRDYARKFNGHDNSRLNNDTAELSFDSGQGACFARYATFVWDELIRGGAFLQSPLATEEIEESLWALLLSSIANQNGENGRQHKSGYGIYVKPAEEYILGHLDTPIQVADIAAYVGTSVATLNRAFRRCHGMGPKAFVKQRRLERVQTELLRADPEATSVTEIATKYAFWHLSQFAADYKRAFHESPSESLRRN